MYMMKGKTKLLMNLIVFENVNPNGENVEEIKLNSMDFKK
jgi:hypothetical protein